MIFKEAINLSLKDKASRIGTNQRHFYRIIKSDDEFVDNLKSIGSYVSRHKSSFILDGTIDLNNDFYLEVLSEIESVCLTDENRKINFDEDLIEKLDIVLYDNNSYVKVVKEALIDVSKIAFKLESFSNAERKKFVAKMLTYLYGVIDESMLSTGVSEVPKCFYYGQIKRHDIYFLILLNLINFDVFYINPRTDPTSFILSNSNIKTTIIEGPKISNISTFLEKIK